jgi:hypothetical protein
MEDFTLKGKRIFVHCHAGQGRTGIICASFLFFAGIAKSGEHAVRLFKTQRLSSGALKRESDVRCVKSFCHYVIKTRLLLYPSRQAISMNNISEYDPDLPKTKLVKISSIPIEEESNSRQ